MLVLTRKLGEQIPIGDGMVVTVVNLSRGRVRLGITGPNEVTIVRPPRDELASSSSAAEKPLMDVRRQCVRTEVV